MSQVRRQRRLSECGTRPTQPAGPSQDSSKMARIRIHNTNLLQSEAQRTCKSRARGSAVTHARKAPGRRAERCTAEPAAGRPLARSASRAEMLPPASSSLKSPAADACQWGASALAVTCWALRDALAASEGNFNSGIQGRAAATTAGAVPRPRRFQGG